MSEQSSGSRPVYLDHNATTPAAPEVLTGIRPAALDKREVKLTGLPLISDCQSRIPSALAALEVGMDTVT